MKLPTIYQAKKQTDVITIEPGDPDETAARLLQEQPAKSAVPELQYQMR